MVDTEGTLTLPFASEGTRFERNGTIVRQRTTGVTSEATLAGDVDSCKGLCGETGQGGGTS